MTPDAVTMEAACMTRSASEAARYLTDLGFKTSESRCAVKISALIYQGKRKAKSAPPPQEFEVGRIDQAAAAMACTNLAEAMNAYFDRKVDRLGCSFEAAKLSSLYSMDQLARMAA